MRISVIIPTYNRAQWLAEAVASAIRQSVPPAEVLVVDDGSTDETRVVVQELVRQAGLPIRYIEQANRGAAGARNAGILAARGDYLCFLDSDDRFAPEKIARQAAALRDSGCLLSHTREQWLRRGLHLNQKKKHRPPHGDIFAASLGMCVVGMSTVMVKREVFDRYGLFDESLPCCEDYDLWLRVGCRERFHLLDLPLTVKNGGRPDQLSVCYRQGMDKFRIKSLVKLLESGALSPDQSQLVIRELERKCDLYGRGCIKHGRSEEGNAVLQLPARFR